MPKSILGASPKARPILMSGSMVRALLQGRKTQTRRTQGLEDVNELPDLWNFHQIGTLDYMTKKAAKGRFGAYFHSRSFEANTLSVCPQACPYGEPGDLLWVREAVTHGGYEDAPLTYAADGRHGEVVWPGHWMRHSRPSIHMPRWASRLTLEVTELRVERLQEISEADAVTEGIFEAADLGFYIYDSKGTPGKHCCDSAKSTYACLWESLNGPGSWESNPWVWGLEFKVHQQNVDILIAERAAA